VRSKWESEKEDGIVGTEVLCALSIASDDSGDEWMYVVGGICI
jgi:hypothetical protein